MLFLRRFRNEFVAVIVIIIIILVLGNLVKYDYITKTFLEQNKDLIDALSGIVGLLILIIGATASYYRFFRGRTYAKRITIELDVSVFSTRQDFMLHAISINISNIGTVQIREPNLIISAYQHRNNGSENQTNINLWEPMQKKYSIGDEFIIDTQESSQYYALYDVPEVVRAVTYLVELNSKVGDYWRTAKTVSNQITPEI